MVIADRYWVAGGNGNVSSTGNWSTSSGGASGASKPGAGDNAYVDLNSGTGTVTVDETTTYTRLEITGRPGYTTLVIGAALTISDTLVLTGANASTQRIYVRSSVTGTAATIAAAIVSLTNVDFEDIAGAGAAAPFTGTSIGNCGGNTNITQTTPITCYAVTNASKAFTDAFWFTTSGGAVAARVPLPQDTAVFDANSITAGSVTITIGTDSFRLPSINFTGVTNTPTFSLNSATPQFYGSLTMVAGMTFSQTGLASFKGRGSYTLTSAGKTFSGAQVDFNAYGGTYTLQDALSVPGSYLTLTRGTLADGGFAVGAYGLAGPGSNARGLTISGTWTMTGSASPLDLSGSNLTVTATNSTFVFTDASGATKTIDGGGKTLYNLTLSGAGAGAYSIGGVSTAFAGTTTVSNTGGASVDLFAASSMTHKNVTFTGATVTWAGTIAGTISGSLTLASGVTVSHTGGLTFSATTTATITNASKTIAEALTFNGVGGTWTLQDAATWTAATTLTNGTLAFSTFNSAILSLSSSNANARTISGSGTITITGANTVWDVATATNLTISLSSATLKLNNASSTVKTFAGGGKTYGNIWLTGAGTGTFDFTGSNTFTDLKCDTPPHTIRFTAGTTTTVTTLTIHGSTADDMTLGGVTSATWTITSATTTPIVVTYCAISYSTATPASTFYARVSTDSGNNSGWTFNGSAPGLARIIYNPNIDFDEELESLTIDYPDVATVGTSDSGISETLTRRSDCLVDLSISMLEDADLKRALQNWFAWAKRGQAWYFARNSGNTVLTTLSSTAAAGATTISLTSTAGIVEGDLYVIRSADSIEIREVATVTPTTVTITDALLYAYASGDRFRAEQYWPGRLVSMDSPIIERPPILYDFDLRFREDVNDL